MDIATALAAVATGDRVIGTTGDIIDLQGELKEGGVDVPWWQKLLPGLAGPIFGPEIYKQNLERKAGRLRESQAETLRETESAGVTAAALKEMEAARNMMRQEIGTGVQNIRNRYGQAGTFQSGARGRREDAFRQQGLQSLAGAFAGIELDAVRARQSGAANTLALQMQQANFAWQKQQQENAMLTSLISTALPFFMKDGQNDPSLSLDPTQAFGDIGLDPFLAQAPNWQLADEEEQRRALARMGG